MGLMDTEVEHTLEGSSLWLPLLPDLWKMAAGAIASGVLVMALFAAGAPILDQAYVSLMTGNDTVPMDLDPEWVERASDEELLREIRSGRLPSGGPHPAFVVFIGVLGGLLGGTLVGAVPWLLRPTARLRVAAHWVELDGVRIERADLRDLVVRDDRLVVRLQDGSIRSSRPLLRPVEADFHLEEALSRVVNDDVRRERVARAEALHALRSVSQGAASSRS